MHSRKISITFKSQEYTFGKFPQTVIKGVFGVQMAMAACVF